MRHYIEDSMSILYKGKQVRWGMISTNQCQYNSLHFIKVCKLVGLLETWYRINGNTLLSWFSHYKPALASQGYIGKILNNRKRPSFNIRHPHFRTVRHRKAFWSIKFFHLLICYPTIVKNCHYERSPKDWSYGWEICLLILII